MTLASPPAIGAAAAATSPLDAKAVPQLLHWGGFRVEGGVVESLVQVRGRFLSACGRDVILFFQIPTNEKSTSI